MNKLIAFLFCWLAIGQAGYGRPASPGRPGDSLVNRQVDHLDLYLLIGQSNMAGRATFGPEESSAVDGAFLYYGDQEQAWVPLTNPLNRFSTIRKQIDMQRLGPGYAFAGSMVQNTDKQIGLVVNARGGSAIVEWLPGTHYFEEAVARTRQAMHFGTLRGIIWHQGESDSGSPRSGWYLQRLEVMVQAFREAFGDPDLPFVLGEISEDRPHRAAFNQLLAQVPAFIPHSAVVSAAGTTTTDSTHFDRASQLLLGERYARAMRSLHNKRLQNHPAIKTAENNAGTAAEGFRRSYDYLHAWLAERDPQSGLIPRNLGTSRHFWNAQDAAADNYPFMVLTAALLDRDVFDNEMRQMLDTETRLTSRRGSLPDTYSFQKQDFLEEDPDLDRIIFGASEYIKDGLLPLTEWLGVSPWSERMIAMLDDIWRFAPFTTLYGNIPSDNVEVNGEMLQTLARIYWMTGDRKYLNWALRLGDYYLLGDQHPARDRSELRLRDHGCEIVSGLCELYFTVAQVASDKKAQYEAPIHQLLDRILEVGLNEHGLMYDAVNPQTGAVLRPRVADNWGYNYNGFYTVYLVDGTERYRQAIERALGNLHFYRNFDWENGSQDGYADAIEGGLNLYNRLPVPVAAEWLDSEIRVMWSMQDSSHRDDTEAYRGNGIIEGWHGDGNFARTTLMYCFWKTQGTYLSNWRKDVVWGAAPTEDGVLIYLRAEQDWSGRLHFDTPRHRTVLQLPSDYPRINQFPEWYAVEQQGQYTVQRLPDGARETFTGDELAEGLPLSVPAGEEILLRIYRK